MEQKDLLKAGTLQETHSGLHWIEEDSIQRVQVFLDLGSQGNLDILNFLDDRFGYESNQLGLQDITFWE